MMQTTLRPSSLGGLRDRIRARWPNLADGDLERAGGSLDKLVDTIHAVTAEPRPLVKRELRRILVAPN